MGGPGMKELELTAAAKINWGLDIVGRRADGYHLLRSLMQNIGLYDRLRLQLSATDDCRCEGMADGDNLALCAWLLMKQQLGLRQHLHISIDKHIPIGSGLGGGSSDAAAVLRGANQLLQLGLSDTELAALGLQIGADLPFCLRGGLALVEGIGEIVQPLAPGPRLWLVLADPGFPVPTPAVYQAYDKLAEPLHPDLAALQAAVEQGNVAAIRQYSGNALQAAAMSLYPQLAAAERAVAALGPRPLLSGSGGALFTPCANEDEAQQVAAGWGRTGMEIRVVSSEC